MNIPQSPHYNMLYIIYHTSWITSLYLKELSGDLWRILYILRGRNYCLRQHTDKIKWSNCSLQVRIYYSSAWIMDGRSINPIAWTCTNNGALCIYTLINKVLLCEINWDFGSASNAFSCQCGALEICYVIIFYMFSRALQEIIL